MLLFILSLFGYLSAFESTCKWSIVMIQLENYMFNGIKHLRKPKNTSLLFQLMFSVHWTDQQFSGLFFVTRTQNHLA